MTPPLPTSIIVGDPKSKCATFSRFILPFPYFPQPIAAAGSKAGTPIFTEAHAEDWLHSPLAKRSKTDVISAEDRKRRDYLRRETSDVLFERARWFALHGMEKLVFELVPDGTGTGPTVEMRPPAIVLFEMPLQSATNVKTEAEVDAVLQVGFLVVELFFKDEAQATLDNLALLNELFRYRQRPFQDHSEHDKDYRRYLGNLPRNPLDPQGLKLKDSGKVPHPELEFYLKRWSPFLQCPVQLESGKCFKLMPDKWISDAEAWVCGHPGPKQSHGWLAHADYRAFVWSCAVAKKDSNLLLAVRELAKSDEETVKALKILPDSLGAWAKFLNVDDYLNDPQDDSKTPASAGRLPETKRVTPFNRRWAAERTYMGWAHFGALQGYCQHAGVMLTGPCSNPPTWRHFGAMYFDQALLLLYCREVLFRFSYRVSRYSLTATDSDKTKEEFGDQFKRLRAQFTRFTNRYQFPLLSNQQQALELYQMLRDNLEVMPLFEEVKEEVETTTEF